MEYETNGGNQVNAREFFKITKIEITFLVDMVAIAAFLSDPNFSMHSFEIIPLLVSGTLASMSAAVFNNLYDMDIDRAMKRTSYRERIINNRTFGRISVYAGIMLAASVLVSYLFINLLTSAFIFLGFLSYVVLYTIVLKRRTTWNIVIGGIAGSFPALAGWSAVSNDISTTSLFIAFLVFLWTPTHFWSLATNNSDDYKEAGIPMLPAVVGARKAGWWILINSIILVVYSAIPLFVSSINVGFAYYLVAIAMGAIMLYYVIKPMTEQYSKPGFRRAFHISNYYLLTLLVSICLVGIIH